MPRMNVNLRPSTISFDDGENPVVSGIARFGAAMAQLPPQLQHLRMRQAAADEDQRRFDVMQATRDQELHLRMGEDQRQSEEHGLHMQEERGKAIHEGYVTPTPENPANLTPQDQADLENAAEGREQRDAQQLHLKMTPGGEQASFTPFKSDELGDVIIDHRTGTYRPMTAAEAQGSAGPAPRAAPSAPASTVRAQVAPTGDSRAGTPSAYISGSPGSAPGGGHSRSAAEHMARMGRTTAATPEEQLHGQIAQVLGPEHADEAFQTLLHGSNEERTSLLTSVPHLHEAFQNYVSTHRALQQRSSPQPQPLAGN